MSLILDLGVLLWATSRFALPLQVQSIKLFIPRGSSEGSGAAGVTVGLRGISVPSGKKGGQNESYDIKYTRTWKYDKIHSCKHLLA